jgi:hypothetical protein
MERPIFEVKLIEPSTRKVLFQTSAAAEESEAEAPPKRKLKLILKKKAPAAPAPAEELPDDVKYLMSQGQSKEKAMARYREFQAQLAEQKESNNVYYQDLDKIQKKALEFLDTKRTDKEATEYYNNTFADDVNKVLSKNNMESAGAAQEIIDEFFDEYRAKWISTQSSNDTKKPIEEDKFGSGKEDDNFITEDLFYDFANKYNFDDEGKQKNRKGIKEAIEKFKISRSKDIKTDRQRRLVSKLDDVLKTLMKEYGRKKLIPTSVLREKLQPLFSYKLLF